ncbi:MAG: helix-turn-helix domain-containing protein [Dermatophilaceae bacterium]
MTADVFGTAPRELTASITLSQTLDLIRATVGVVEDEVDAMGSAAEAQVLREAVLRYSREIAFSAAEVYAQAAESRGAWDARLEALVVDAVLRGEADDSMQSRATALGWGSVAHVTVIAGRTPTGATAYTGETIRRAARHVGAEALSAVQRRRLVVILGGSTDALASAAALAGEFGDGPIVVGPTVPHLFAAGRSARAALNGLLGGSGVAAGPPPGPRRRAPARASRSSATIAPGDNSSTGSSPRCEANDTLLQTAHSFLEVGGLEATARVLFVHPNTVRYRLGRIAERDRLRPHPPQRRVCRAARARPRAAIAPEPAPRGGTWERAIAFVETSKGTLHEHRQIGITRPITSR